MDKVRRLRLLIGFECSGAVRRAFRDLGFDAWSCDLEPAEDKSPHHIQGDIFEHLDKGWAAFGFHPPCTYLSVSGIHWNDRGRGWDETNRSLEVVRRLMQRPEPWYLENPVSIISSRIRKPDQTIQPYHYGHDASKTTCLWLNRLPVLPTPPTSLWTAPRLVCPVCKRVVGPEDARGSGWPEREVACTCGGRLKARWDNQTDSGQNKLPPGERRAVDRARTYRGIAQAMAEAWGPWLRGNLKS